MKSDNVFILAPETDRFALYALRAYAYACADENPVLAGELNDWADKIDPESKNQVKILEGMLEEITIKREDGNRKLKEWIDNMTRIIKK